MKKTLIALTVAAFATSASAVTVAEKDNLKLDVTGKVDASVTVSSVLTAQAFEQKDGKFVSYTQEKVNTDLLKPATDKSLKGEVGFKATNTFESGATLTGKVGLALDSVKKEISLQDTSLTLKTENAEVVVGQFGSIGGYSKLQKENKLGLQGTYEVSGVTFGAFYKFAKTDTKKGEQYVSVPNVGIDALVQTAPSTKTVKPAAAGLGVQYKNEDLGITAKAAGTVYFDTDLDFAQVGKDKKYTVGGSFAYEMKDLVEASVYGALSTEKEKTAGVQDITWAVGAEVAVKPTKDLTLTANVDNKVKQSSWKNVAAVNVDSHELEFGVKLAQKVIEGKGEVSLGYSFSNEVIKNRKDDINNQVNSGTFFTATDYQKAFLERVSKDGDKLVFPHKLTAGFEYKFNDNAKFYSNVDVLLAQGNKDVTGNEKGVYVTSDKKWERSIDVKAAATTGLKITW